MGGAATKQFIMGKRPVDVVDLTGADVMIDLTRDSEPLPRVKSKIKIPWISKLPKHDPSKKMKVACRLSERENINLSELRKYALWFEQAEVLFSAAMPH